MPVEADYNRPGWSQHADALPLAERKLPSYVAQQRWYPAKDAQPPELALDRLIPLPAADAVLAVWRASVADRETFGLFIPLAVIARENRGCIDAPAIAELSNGDLVIDAAESDSFIRGLVHLMLQGSQSDQLQAVSTDRTDFLRELPESQWGVKRASVEQSNTSIRVANRSILKVNRKIAPGVHPELEMARFLTEIAHFGGTPALLGWINLGDATVAILQEFVSNEGDGWTWIRTHLQSGAVESDKAREWLAGLGRITAELHAALDTTEGGAAFRAETAEKEDWRRWSQEIASMAERVRDTLTASQSKLDLEAQRLADQFQKHAGGLADWLASFESSPPSWLKTRHHGDFHLGQVLVRGNDAVIVDFEGEPLRSLSERRAKHVPLRDVAGMLRSIQYASASVQRELPVGLPAEQRLKEAERLSQWAADASRDFFDNYLQRLQESTDRHTDAPSAKRIVEFFLIEKALYEVLYELANRPDWTSIPLRSVVRQLTELKPMDRENTTAEAAHFHRMPFGAEHFAAGGVRFRLWAPQCPEVSVAVRSADSGIARTMKMACLKDGWHELLDLSARAGALYDFVLPDGMHAPDPASRFQPFDVHGPSEVIDPRAYHWSEAWKGREWAEAVIYELHVGTFTPAGTFLAAIERLDHLAALGVSAIELMPIADFPGKRNWGYDGALWYAPDSSYGRPEDLKSLVAAAHARGIMVLLDVVYNHFGPDGNFLPTYAPGFFTDRHKTPWGAAVNYDGPHARTVREFVIHNALYWIEEFNLDGLRLDAVHAIIDDSPTHLLAELAQRLRAERSRPIHLLLENEENAAHWLSRGPHGSTLAYSAQWNDDVHHVLHVAATAEAQGYYADYVGQTQKLGRALAEGFAFQGEIMPFSGRSRGEPSGVLPPASFVAFIQNHDQIGNRAFGERVTRLAKAEAVRAIAAVYLLLPQIPMLFMGEEWGSQQPFPFFCDFHGALGDAVRKGRREEFAKFPEFQNEANRQKIPDPQAESTFLSAKLRWEEIDDPKHAAWLDFYRRLLAVRRASIIPILGEIRRGGRFEVLGAGAVQVDWLLDSGGWLVLDANLSNASVRCAQRALNHLWKEGSVQDSELGPWSVGWSISSQNQP